MNDEEIVLKLIEDNLYKTCKGLECNVVKNNIDLRLENIQLKKQINLMAFNLADYVMYYEYDKCRNPEMIKNKADELKQYFANKVNSKIQ